MSNIREKLKERKGNGVILACVIVLALMLMISGISEYMRLQMIAQGIKEALQSAVIGVATANYDDAYNGLREGYSGGYELNENDQWVEQIDYGAVLANLDQLLGLEEVEEEQAHKKFIGGRVEYSLSDLNVNIINGAFAPGSGTNGSRIETEATIMVAVPLSFGFETLPPLHMKLKVRAGYMPKF